MNRYPRFLALIAAVVFVCMLVIGITGIYTQYGDIRSAVSYAVKDSSAGNGLENGILITFLCPSETEPTEEEISSVCKTLEDRLFTYGLADANVYYDTNMHVFAVETAYGQRSGYDPNLLYNYLGKIGRITIRPGNEKDDDGKPAGITAETVIADGKDIKDVAFSVEETSGSTQYICDIKFSGESRESIRTYTDKVKDESTSGKYYSIWLDDEMITARAFKEVIKNGVVPAGTVVYSSDLADDYIGLRIIAGSGELPYELTGAYVYNLSDPDRGAKFEGALILLAAAAVVFAVFAGIRYRLAGLGAAAGMTGFCGALCFILSGGLDAGLGLYITRNKIYILAAAMAAVIFTLLSLLERMKQSLGSSTPFRAAREAFSAAEKSGALILAALILITVIVRLLSDLTPAVDKLYEVMFTVSVFTAAGYVFALLGSACVIKSLASTNRFNDEKLYGGVSA